MKKEYYYQEFERDGQFYGLLLWISLHIRRKHRQNESCSFLQTDDRYPYLQHKSRAVVQIAQQPDLQTLHVASHG